jgi:putative inorganic carbon (HCO3(-)) transporter
MRDIFIVTLILILYYFSMRSAYAACLTYWWFSIFRPQDWVYMDIGSLKLPLLATVIFFMVSIARGYRPKINDKLSVMMVLFWLLGTIASFIYGCSSEYKVIEPIEYLGLLFIAIFLTIDIVKTKNQLFGLVLVVALSLAFYTGKGGIIAILGGGAVNEGSENLGGMFTGSNAYAMGTAILLFFMIFIFKQSSSFKSVEWIPSYLKNRTYLIKAFMLLMIIGSVFNVVSLFSRGSAIAMGCGFLVLYLLSNKKLKVFFYSIPIALILIATIPVPDGYEARMESVFVETEELDSSAASRPYFWNIAVQIVSDNPIGVGFGCYPYYYNYYATQKHGKSRDVHSSHFNVLSDSGYVGIVVWILLFLVSITRLLSLRRLLNQHKENLDNYSFYYHLCEAALAAQVVFMLGGSFYTLTYMDLIWWIWGLTIILTKLINQEITGIRTKSQERKLV